MRIAVTGARGNVGREVINYFHQTGELRLPAGDGRVSFVSRCDVGRCLGELALREDDRSIHEVTGPSGFNMFQVAEQLSTSEKTIEYVNVSPEEFKDEIIQASWYPWWICAYTSMFESIREGRWEKVSTDVEDLTGRAPVSFREIVEVK